VLRLPPAFSDPHVYQRMFRDLLILECQVHMHEGWRRELPNARPSVFTIDGVVNNVGVICRHDMI